MIDIETVLKQSDPKKTGVFLLEKCVFLIEGETTGVSETKRCDDVSFSGVIPTEGTPYAFHAHSFYAPSNVSNYVMSVKKVEQFGHVISVTPHFYIRYVQLNEWYDSEADPTPSTMWGAKSIFQLFKNMREWSFMVDEPFNSDHPMATYSKLVFDTLNPPKSIMDEIDSLPDMHLAKFLKGQNDYKMVPHPYPEVSQEFKNWITQLTVDYSEKSFEQMLDEL